MKFWELTSAFRGFDRQLIEVLTSGHWNQPYGEWLKNWSQLVHSQERNKLDAEVPKELVLEVAAAVGNLLVLYLNQGWLRSRQFSPTDIKLTALEVVKKYGGSVIEETLEKGLCKVET